MTLDKFLVTVVGAAITPKRPAEIWQATRQLAAINFWRERPVPYYTDEFYRKDRS